MLRRVKMIMIVIVIFILLGIISFILLAKFYPPLNLKLFGGETPISFDEIRFWVKKVPQRNYYRVYASYEKSPETALDFGHGLYFTMVDKKWEGGWRIVFNPEDNKIYGGGWWEERVFCLGEGGIENNLFKPIFPEGTKFTFLMGGSIVITDAPAYYITIHLPGILKKLEKEELEKPSLAEIIEEETKVKE